MRHLRRLSPASSLVMVSAALVAAVAMRSAPLAQTAQLIPAAASSLVLRPDAFIGATVSVTATIEQLLTATTFSVDQDAARSTGQDVLVIAPTLNEPPTPGAYVTIIGTVLRFEPERVAELAKDYTLDLPPDAVAKYRGKPAILARAVIDGKMVDLAKPPVVPLTPEEEELDQAMKEVNAAFPAMRSAIDSANADVTEEYGAILAESFATAETFFKGREATDAIGWAQEAQKIVASVREAAAAGRWAEATETAGTVTRLCQSCHGAYRERQDDGTFRVKQGGR